MTRRTLLVTLAGGTAAVRGARFRVYARCLPDCLAGLAREAYERRNAALAAVKTPADVRARQEWARRTFWQLAGGEPERTPLRVQETGSFRRDGYRVTLLRYQSRPGIDIPANLYVPSTGQPPYPGVLFQMGHSVNGKAAETYQKCCQGLARLEYVVLAFDPMGQGERTYYHTHNPDEEHSRAGRQMLLVGDTMTRLQVWDAVRSLDVLAAQPMVDPARLASMGQSGGGTLTMLLAAVDSRLACAAVSSGNTENFACTGFNPPGSTDDAEQNLTGAGPLGFDRWDLLYPLAPKPLLVLASERDFFGTYSPSYLESGEEEFEKLRRMYRLLGAEERIEWGTTALPHALARELRLRCYRFLERWLRGSGSEVGEPAVAPEADATLAAGISAARPPMAAPSPGPAEATTLRSLLRLAPEAGVAARVVRLGRDRGEGCEVATCEVESAPGVFVPCYVFLPEGREGRRLILLLDPGGRTRHWREGGLCQALARAGMVVCAFDVRGMGDLAPEVGRGNPYYAGSHAREEAYAWASMILGRPLLGQRVEDILAVARAAPAEFGAEREVVLAATGHMTTPALCAAALEPGIGITHLSGGLVSWSSIMETDAYAEPFANFLPNVLTVTDLPFVARLARPRRVVVAGAVDAQGRPVELERVRRLYGDGVEVRPGTEWGTETFETL